jgi:signal peptidase II
LNRYLKDYFVLFGIAGVVIALDQWTKWLVRTNLPFRETWLPDWLSWLSPYVRIVNWSNSGAAFGMFQEGAAGNLIDRLMVGEVTDFISVGTFPVFNIADSSITVGVVVLLLGVWLKERAAKKVIDEKQDTEEDNQAIRNEQ